MLDECKFLVLSGGGVNGIMHIGALKFIDLHLRGTKDSTIYAYFEGFSGTSIGALISLLCVLNMSPDQMLEVFRNNLGHFSRVGISTSFLSQHHALQDQKPFVEILERLLFQAHGDPHLTFAELYEKTNKDLVITATNLCTSKLKFFRHRTTPHVHVIAAVIASMAIPFVFPAVIIEEVPYVDGGCMVNFPLMAFPNTSEVLGLWIVSHRTECRAKKIKQSLKTYAIQVMKSLFFAQDELLDHMVGDEHTIIQLQTSTFPLPFGDDFPITKQLLSGAMHVFFHFWKKKKCAGEELVLFMLFMVMAAQSARGRVNPAL